MLKPDDIRWMIDEYLTAGPSFTLAKRICEEANQHAEVQVRNEMQNALTKIHELETDNVRLSQMKTGRVKYNTSVFYTFDNGQNLGFGALEGTDQGRNRSVKQIYPTPADPNFPMVLVPQKDLIAIDDIERLYRHHRAVINMIKDLHAMAVSQ